MSEKYGKLRLWTTASDWEAIVWIKPDGTEEVLYEHHNADSEVWQRVIKTVFGVQVEDVYLVDALPGGWSYYREIDPDIRRRLNEAPSLGTSAFEMECPHFHQALDPKKVALGLPLNLHHEHAFTDPEHAHPEIDYGPRRLNDFGED